MYIKKFIYFIYFFNIQIIFSYGLNNVLVYTIENITDYHNYDTSNLVYDKDIVLNKAEVLKIKDDYNLSCYCKNDICVKVNRHDLPSFIEIPDEKGNIKRYISISYNLNDLKLHRYENGVYMNLSNCTSSTNQLNNINNEFCFTGIFLSFKCTSDSQCLTNKCIDGVCVFNEDKSFELCSDIYSYFAVFSHSYMYCGKSYGDLCKTDEECGSKICLEEGVCGPTKEPSETDVKVKISTY
ncbi:hypothetical protein PIROE2DRAFT_21617 [Piromyces sp. E2]|nr:hypothetical protein PIROE2DRAFT_21617 [Piromyces sp. E2]|eukprot:OUM56391.1 hypothetical protein PIROE2DRAFT_21617 [Piromyces sp. E2]